MFYKKERAEYKAAKKASDKLQKSQDKRGIREETPAYLKTNKRVNDAMGKLPWYLR